MRLFKYCTCGHLEEEHAMDAPEGQQECMHQDEETDKQCDCENFEWDAGEPF